MVRSERSCNRLLILEGFIIIIIIIIIVIIIIILFVSFFHVSQVGKS